MGDVEMTVPEFEREVTNDKLDAFIRELDGPVTPTLTEYITLFETCTRPAIKKTITLDTKLKFIHKLVLNVQEFLFSGDADARVFFRLLRALKPQSNNMVTLERFWTTVNDEPSYCIAFRINDRVFEQHTRSRLPNLRAVGFKLAIRHGNPRNEDILESIWNVATEDEIRATELQDSQLETLAGLSGISMQIILQRNNRLYSAQARPDHRELLDVMSYWIESAVAASCVFVQHPIEMQSGGFLDMSQ